MRKFNPERELYKIKYGKRNKIILACFLMIFVSIISYSFALYQVRHSKRIIYTTVSDFRNNKDLNLAVYLDNQELNNFPEKKDNVVFSNIVCEENKKVNASWNYNTWSIDMEIEVPNKCDIYFETRYKDQSGANPPELYQGLIPVTIDEDGTIKVANLSEKWYDYDNHEWANAVLVTTEKYNELTENGKLKKEAEGQVLNLTSGEESTTKADGDILQMYVWIPRYRYQLFNTLFRGVDPQSINIIFEGKNTGKSNGQQNGEWLTHPAFTFGDTELPGIWVGKFEPSEKDKGITGTINKANEAIQNITILPNKVSIVNRNLSTMFKATRGIESDSEYNLNSSEIDTHIMKNMEWGAVAYLSQSIYGIFAKQDNNIICNIDANLSESTCRIYINNVSHSTYETNDGAITGCSGASIDASQLTKKNACESGRSWYEDGVKASTTGNKYGIYDMSGGEPERVMGNMVNSSGTFNANDSGFKNTDGEVYPDAKYYDSYAYVTSNYAHYRGHLGDATRETLKTYSNGDTNGWNGDATLFVGDLGYAWLRRGGYAKDATKAGLFEFHRDDGNAYVLDTFRVVLTAQDGKE